MIHYHGTPITPQAELAKLAGRHFCVSYAEPRQVHQVHEIGQSVMLDNGAFSAWRRGLITDDVWWHSYHGWVEKWLEHPTTWAVIPDMIEGSEEDNDLLIAKYPRSLFDQSAPVWHMHESLDRLKRLCHGWRRVCIGSSAEYAQLGTPSWHRRMEQAMNAICGNGPVPTWLHMLRGMALAGTHYPFASVDSTDLAQNHNRAQNSIVRMADRWDAKQNPARWEVTEQLELEAA